MAIPKSTFRAALRAGGSPGRPAAASWLGNRSIPAANFINALHNFYLIDRLRPPGRSFPGCRVAGAKSRKGGAPNHRR
jgi:hypothetical protein